MASLARTSLGPRTDRTAAHAAVRNLAESYGVDLLPLELNTSLSITPLKPLNSNSRPSSVDLPRSGSLPDHALSGRSSTDLHSIPAFPCDELDKAAQNESMSPAHQQAETTHVATDSLVGTTAPLCATGPAASAAVEDLPATSDAAEAPWLGNSSYLSEEEYLQYQIPLEQQLLMLEEERDHLVDKLLATTEALHASEARNRESQASASQVSALLNQLQELLRRAEVERDKAKMQLKRQRMSASQIPTSSSGGSEVVAQLAAAAPMPAPVLQQQQQQRQQLDDSAGFDHERMCQDANSSSNNDATGHNTPQRWLKKHKSNCGSTSSSSLAVLDPDAALGRESSTDAVLLPSNRQHSSSSSEGSSSAVVDQIEAVDTDGAGVTLTPSSNEVRPPVSSIISGFESLAKQKRRQAAARAAAAAAALASRRSSGVATAASGVPLAGASSASAEDSGELLLPAVTAPATSDAAAAATSLAATTAASDLVASRQMSQDDDCSSQSSLVIQQQMDSSSVASTPTAAAVYNASPTAFAAEAAAAGGLGFLKPAVAATYAEVTKRDGNGSESRESSRSPTKRAVRSACKSDSTHAVAEQVCDSSSSEYKHNNSSRLPAGLQVQGKHGTEASISHTGGAAAAAVAQAISHCQQQPQKQSQLKNAAEYAAAAAVEQQKQQEEQQPLQSSHEDKADGLDQQDSRTTSRGDIKRSIDAAVQAVDPLGDCTAEVKAAVTAAESNDRPSSSVAHGTGDRSSSPKKKSSRKQQQQVSRDSDVKLTNQDTRVRAASSAPVIANGTGMVEVTSSTHSSRRQPRSLLMLTVAVVCLLAGGLLHALIVPSMLQGRHTAPVLQDGEQLAQLQAKLAAAQQKVQVLEQQLRDESLACQLCEKGRSVPDSNTEL